MILTGTREIEGAEGDYLGFECLTFVPIDRTLIEKTLMTAEEIAWLDRYHAKVWDILSPQMEGEDLAWLERHCAPI